MCEIIDNSPALTLSGSVHSASYSNSISMRVEIVERINHNAMIQQMRSVFSQSPVLAS
ncbi:MAG: hypothetical protein NE327_05760 [Lentisphaeraceae bacterium]|nr:hypothetical protein [Lentisphaeraceae bacterium]